MSLESFINITGFIEIDSKSNYDVVDGKSLVSDNRKKKKKM